MPNIRRKGGGNDLIFYKEVSGAGVRSPNASVNSLSSWKVSIERRTGVNWEHGRD